ncbi:MAG: acyl CoA--acetate/3-ketoacid CoA transferase subunit alpha [Myxococcales bacterium]|nr:acyl CoA--acetate/3-ketoacid CoA transferase subunit alpha [Myxococcales bacterium]
MADKRCTVAEVIGKLESGMTLGIGGWGSRRKPMALVKALAESSVTDLTVVSFAGPDLGLLCAAGKVRKAVYGFVSLDSIPLEPFFRRARQRGEIQVREWDEGMMVLGLEAASRRLPFTPTRAGLGSSVIALNPDLKTVTSPYEDGEALLAVPALPLDAALLHVHRADVGGNGQILSPDPFFDELFARAAQQVFLSTERLIDTADFPTEGSVDRILIPRMQVTGVVEVPGGAGFTECLPDYPRDESAQAAYAAAVGAEDPLAAALASLS